MIEVSHLVKEFKIPVQKKGRFAAVRNLFSSEHTIKRAVDDITFSVDDGEIVGFIGKMALENPPRLKCFPVFCSLPQETSQLTVSSLLNSEWRMLSRLVSYLVKKHNFGGMFL